MEHLQFPNESAEYREARNALLIQEMELRRQIERVAQERRKLPTGGRLKENYRFVSKNGPVNFSDLFANGKNVLAVYSFMYGPDRERPCPGCTHFLDGLNGQVQHIDQMINFVVVAKSPVQRILDFAKERNWDQLHFLSTDGNTYDKDYFGDDLGLTRAMREQQDFKDGKVWDMPILNVFQKKDGIIHHFWGCETLYVPAEPGQEYRHNDLLDPLWNMLDLSPEGRGSFHPKLSYPD
jgi:predicted dithiol-disulfide oxidoreductase (DUF899 family)